MPEEGILTGTYFARDQVPDGPNFSRTKNKLSSWDKYFMPRHNYIYFKEISMNILILKVIIFLRRSIPGKKSNRIVVKTFNSSGTLL